MEKKDLEPLFTQKMSRQAQALIFMRKKNSYFLFSSFLFYIFFYTEENDLFCVFNLYVSTG